MDFGYAAEEMIQDPALDAKACCRVILVGKDQVLLEPKLLFWSCVSRQFSNVVASGA